MNDKSNNNSTKRKIITANECKYDLREYLQDLFNAVNQGIKGYNEIIPSFPVEARTRSCEANILNSKIVEAIQKQFPEKWNYGKYRRFILRIVGYNILFKKLDKKGFPMNVRTKRVLEIENQSQTSLYDGSFDFADTYEPIVFFGFKKDEWGIIVDLQLVYIDEGKIKWTITESEFIEEGNYIGSELINPNNDQETMVKIRKSAQNRDKNII